MSQKPSTSENHAKAPQSAAFVTEYREVFGAENIELIFVKENEVEIGSPSA